MTNPIFLSPALPSELLSYILSHHVYPTTLIICSSRAEFLASLVQDIRRQSSGTTPDPDPDPQDGEQSHQVPMPIEESIEAKHTLLSSPLYQIATSRHIRIIYVPTVTHLRAYLSVFSSEDSRVPVPPATFALSRQRKPHILLYGFLDLHRDTSEWSAQGLCNTTSTLVGLAHRLSWQALVIEPRSHSRGTSLQPVLRETVPILSGGARRLGPDSDEGSWTGRTVEVGRVLGRWFRFQRAQWDIDDSHD
ncbi:hypothetical protein HD806DRAFT_144280 [Xylariaceae sp. AK1471]|nr:hypothetical protein HD806DRAFT_144280 [Xylariaceae sp. AK1471]